MSGVKIQKRWRNPSFQLAHNQKQIVLRRAELQGGKRALFLISHMGGYDGVEIRSQYESERER